MSNVHAAAAPAIRSDEARHPTSLESVFDRLAPSRHSDWAWDNYKPTIEALSRDFGLHRLLEIGGGRDPLFTPEEAAALDVDLTVNDISQEELANGPAAFRKACFDVSGDPAMLAGLADSYDLAFSRMVFEHVHDAHRAWSNLHHILAPGGVAIAFVPTLYALPYLLNMAIPEALSQRLIKLVYPHRTDDGDPKFPAYYDWCYGDSRRIEPRLRAIGYREALVVPFFHHEYFESFPGLRQADDLLNRIAAARDWRLLATYAYVVARK